MKEGTENRGPKAGVKFDGGEKGVEGEVDDARRWSNTVRHLDHWMSSSCRTGKGPELKRYGTVPAISLLERGRQTRKIECRPSQKSLICYHSLGWYILASAIGKDDRQMSLKVDTGAARNHKYVSALIIGGNNTFVPS